MKSRISIFDRDAYYALEEPTTERAWNWEAHCPYMTPHTAMDRATFLLPRRFSRFYKAGRFPEAEKVFIDSLDGSSSREKELRSRAIVVTADSMWSRGAYGETKNFLSSYATQFMGGTRWSVQKSICRLCISILASGGRNSLEDAEDLLIEFIVAMVPKFVKPTQNSAEPLVLWLREINPATYSALALGQIYGRCQLYNEAATLLSWGLDFSGQNPQRGPVKRLLECLREIGLLSTEIFQTLNEEADKPSKYGGRKHNYEHSGSWAVVKNDLFDNCRQQVRALEGQNQGVKKRFYDHLKRNNRDDFSNVDAVWDTMLMTKSG